MIDHSKIIINNNPTCQKISFTSSFLLSIRVYLINEQYPFCVKILNELNRFYRKMFWLFLLPSVLHYFVFRKTNRLVYLRSIFTNRLFDLYLLEDSQWLINLTSLKELKDLLKLFFDLFTKYYVYGNYSFTQKVYYNLKRNMNCIC